MCWFQGESSKMPSLNRTCIEKWRKFNKDWKVIVLDNETIPNYVPEYTEILKESPKRKKAVPKNTNIAVIFFSLTFNPGAMNPHI